MKNIFNFLKSFGIGNWFAILSLFAVILNFVCDELRNIKYDEINYFTNASTFRPQIIIKDTPVISEANFENMFFGNDSLQAEYVDSLLKHSGIKEDLIKFPYFINIKIKYNFQNIGNSLARIIAFYYTDTISTNPILRDSFLDRSFHKLNIGTQALDEFYGKEILQGGNQSLDFSYSVNFSSNKEFTIHFLILYENEIGNIYDTYSWTSFKLPFDYIAYFPSGIDPIIAAKMLPEKIKMNVKAQKNKITHHIYSEEDTDYIKKVLSQ